MPSWLGSTTSHYLWEATLLANPSSGNRFSVEIININHYVWLHYTFPLSFRDIEAVMLYQGIAVTYEAIRGWCLKFSQGYANQIRRQRPKPGDQRHLDEVVIKINGRSVLLVASR